MTEVAQSVFSKKKSGSGAYPHFGVRMPSQSAYPIAIYANGLFQDNYPNPSVPYAAQVEQLNAGITSVILWSIHIHPDGVLYLNDSPFVSGGEILYSTDPKAGVNPDFLALVQSLTGSGGTVQELIASVGSWGGYSDFINWFANRNAVTVNLAALHSAFGITGVDFDFEPEDGYTQEDQNMIIDLTQDVGSIGMFATYCPYMNSGWWIGCLTGVYQQNNEVQIVRWMNLQCYAGGGGNTPQPWVQAVASAENTGIANPQAFIVPGYAVAGAESDGMCPSDLKSTFAGLAGTGTTGGFLWNSGAIWNAEASGQPLCSGAVATPADYALAIQNGLHG